MLFYNPERPERHWGHFPLSPLFNGIWSFSNGGKAAEEDIDLGGRIILGRLYDSVM
jgi:hypothetical protein